ncbi:MAG: class I SAM-dependent methyltransferase [Candidatus Micrarchaeaceae archaeon]
MISEIEEVRNITAGVDGWLADDEGELLFNLAKSCKGKGAIVEIGSWKGKSTIWLGKGSIAGNNVKVWAIDPHTGSHEHHQIFGKVWTFDDFKKNIKRAGLEGIIVPVVASSEQAASSFHEPVELIFIDGAHDYESVKADFELWFPKVIEGGTMVFHDTTYAEGPWRVVEKNLYGSRSFGLVHLIDSITFAQKVKRNSTNDRFRNFSAVCIRRVPKPTRRLLPAPMKLLVRKIMTAAGMS